MWLFVRQLPKPKEVAFCMYIIKIVLKGYNQAFFDQNL